MCMNVSIDVTTLCDKYARELRRKVYTTPKSYLDHIKLYKSLLATKRDEVESIRRKLSFGLEKLYATNEIVAKLQGDMTILKPKLAEQSIKTEEFLKQLAVDTLAASKV
jgi:dynein heavy chain